MLITCDAASDLSAHKAFAERIAQDIWDKRHETVNNFLSIEETAKQACAYNRAEHENKPLVIADFADNPGGGAYGDSTALLNELLKTEVIKDCFGPMVDGEVAAFMQGKKAGSRFKVKLGGKTDPDLGGGTLTLDVELIWAGDGKVVGDGPILNRLEKNFGPTAVVRIGNIDILVVTNAHQILDLQQFKTFGINPEEYDVVTLKSQQHFRAAFGPIAGKVIICESGALCSMNYKKKNFPNIPVPTFPL